MATLKRLLAPTDFSDLSFRGVRYACQLAKDVGAELIVINVVTVDESNAIDKQEIARHKTHLNELVTDMFAGAHDGSANTPDSCRRPALRSHRRLRREGGR